MEGLKLEKIHPSEVRRLVLSGGGAKGAAHITALAAAIACGVDPNKIEVCNGTSAGSIVSSMIAMGYDVDSMFSIMRRLDFTEFMDESDETIKTRGKVVKYMNAERDGNTALAKLSIFPIAPELKRRAAAKGGVYQVEALRNWVEELISSKTAIEHCTFKELHELTLEENSRFCDYEAVAFNQTNGTVQRFSWQDTPDVVVSSAVAASSALPGFLARCKIQLKDAVTAEISESEALYVDGGVANNYDIGAWDLRSNGDEGFNRSVLGFRLTSPETAPFLQGTGPLPNQPIEKGFVNFLGNTFKAVESAQFNNLKNSPKDLARTIALNTEGVQTTDLTVAEDPKLYEALLKSGWDSTCAYFGQKLEFPEKYKVTPSFTNGR